MIFIFRKWIKLQANLSVNKDCVDMTNKKRKKRQTQYKIPPVLLRLQADTNYRYYY